MTKREKAELIKSLHELREEIEAGPQTDDVLAEYRRLLAKATVVLDSALITLST